MMIRLQNAQFLSALTLALLLTWPGNVKGQSPLILVKGSSFVNAKGDTMVFRGLNASDPYKLNKSGHWNKEYFQEMKAWGATIVRLPVHPVYWRDLKNESYLKLLDKGVKWAGELGLYVIIDWHSIGNLQSEQFQDPMYQTTKTETLEFWRAIAKHYKDNTTVAFFELFNEPTTMRGKLGTCSWEQWKEIMQNIIKDIRAEGANTIPLVAGFDWAYDLTEIKENPLSVSGIGYVSHPYPMKRKKPFEEKWTEDWGFVAAKYPLILTEVGFCGENDKGAHNPVISDESYGDAITHYADSRKISYVVWVFDPDWAPMLFSDWNFTPTRQGVFFKRALQSAKKNP